tara:strand:+ start:1152 stop:2015 length:864 start_codon:yes stop_codon:yes gene_type:complete
MMSFLERLEKAAIRTNNLACMGLDPDLDRIPLEGDIYKILTTFYLKILEEMHCKEVYPSMVKPNAAYFEQYGFDGYRALAKLISEYRSAGHLVLLDAKRGDINRTNQAYARAAFEELDADALTVNPYMGVESLEPFMRYLSDGRGLYVLARTSNPGAKDFQEKIFNSDALYEHVVNSFLDIEKPGIGFVMGGTSPGSMKRILCKLQTRNQPVSLLIPGFGAQGASTEQVMDLFRDFTATRYLHRMNASSSINYAWQNNLDNPEDYAIAAVAALRKFVRKCKLKDSGF